MILVDTSVLVDFLKGTENEKTLLFSTIIEKNLPYGIPAYAFQEVLQGARNENEYKILKEYLGSQTIYCLEENIQNYEEAARLYFDLRRNGVTLRSAIDILIALIAIKNDLSLLHNDGDFDALASCVKHLRILVQLF